MVSHLSHAAQITFLSIAGLGVVTSLLGLLIYRDGLGAVETPAAMDRLGKPSQAQGQFKITQAVSIGARESGPASVNLSAAPTDALQDFGIDLPGTIQITLARNANGG
jgi:hypothetical protein